MIENSSQNPAHSVVSGPATKPRRWMWIIVTAICVLLAGFALVYARFLRKPPSVPTAFVMRGVLEDFVHIEGQVKARHSVLVYAPYSVGQARILQLLPTGKAVKPGDVVVQFDTAKLQQTLDEKRSALKQAQAELEQTRAKARMEQQQDQTDLLKARYDVERAKLEASKQEILSKIDGQEDRLKLADAQQKLTETETKVKTDKQSEQADIRDDQEKLKKAQLDVDQAQQHIQEMTVRASAPGVVTLLPNWNAGGMFSENPPPFRLGDQAWPGAAVAELPDLSSLDFEGQIEEVDRGRLRDGETVEVNINAVPGTQFPATVTEISPLAKIDFTIWPPARHFTLRARLLSSDPRLRPGMGATARVEVLRVPDSILIPDDAAFSKGTRTVAYVLDGPAFKEQNIKAGEQGAGKLAVLEGLKPGERVALADPTVPHAASAVR
ncbi:MAG: efflux RND transporter periplasmic adaptor subunit [Terriglobia bacterium]